MHQATIIVVKRHGHERPQSNEWHCDQNVSESSDCDMLLIPISKFLTQHLQLP